jgi:hypothetical protein
MVAGWTHFALWALAFLGLIARGLSEQQPTTVERVVRLAYAVLSFPVISLLSWLRLDVPRGAIWLVILANSLLWGLGAACGSRRAG